MIDINEISDVSTFPAIIRLLLLRDDRTTRVLVSHSVA